MTDNKLDYIYLCQACGKRWHQKEPLFYTDILKIICGSCCAEVIINEHSIAEYIKLRKKKL